MFKKIILLLLLLAPMSLSAQKFAHFKMSEIADALPDYKKATEELQALANQYTADLENMEKEITAKQEKANKEVTATTPENIRKRYEQELQDMYQRYQQAREDNEKAFGEARTNKMQPLIQRVTQAVNDVAKENNYIYVIDLETSQGSIYVNELLSEDASPKIKAKLGIK